MKTAKCLTVVCAMGIMLSVGLVGNRAEADNRGPCTVARLGWHDSSGGTVQIDCGGYWYYGFGTVVNDCTAIASADTRKAWLAIAQSSLLSGKKVNIDYTPCTGGPAITNVTLMAQ